MLDSQALLWALFDPSRLSPAAAAAIADEAQSVAVSPVSPYELEWKKAKGLLRFAEVPDWRLVLAAVGYDQLPLTVDHAQRAAHLPMLHRDPWDRLLIAQAIAEQLVLVTSDAVVSQYDVRVLW